MNILIFEWGGGTFTHPDITEYFMSKGVKVMTVSYAFSNKNQDDFFEHRFDKVLAKGKFDLVFSTNFFPLVAVCCNRIGIKYVSWCYDNPMDVPDIERTLGLPCNYVFMFDRMQVQGYTDKGFDNVFYMPLAVNTKRLSGLRLLDKDNYYKSQISFVGGLYDSSLDIYMSCMDDFSKGYIESICNSQSNLYGAYLIDNALDDEHYNRISTSLRNGLTLTKKDLSFAMAAAVTRKERIMLLRLLSEHYDVKLYSTERSELLPKVNYMGTCEYFEEMPKIFKLSDINLNITLKIIQSGIPLRALDIMGAGGFLLSNYQPELCEYFIPDKEMVVFYGLEDAFEKSEFYLKHADVRKTIAERGYIKVSEEFDYDVQFSKMFELIGY